MNNFKYIEELVINRNGIKARQKITELLKKDHSAETLFQCCDWYRRLGLLRDALSILSLKDPSQRHINSEETEGRRLLWGARILNLMGASSLALQYCSYLQCSSAEAFRITGNIYLANWEHKKALIAFKEMKKQMPEKDSYASRLQLLSLADAEAGVGHLDQAISQAQLLLKKSSEPLLQNILKSAIGEYLVNKGNYNEAYAYLQSAAENFSKKDQTADHGICLKWYAFTLAKLGKRKAAQKVFKEALQILQKPSYRAEVWLDVLRLQSECGLLEKQVMKNVFYYPGLPQNFKNKMRGFEKSHNFESKESIIKINFSSNEYEIKNRKLIHIPLEIQLLGYLKISMPYGLSKIRALGLLWPEEPFSFPHLQNRLDVIINRLKTTYSIEIHTKKGNFFLSKKSEAKIGVIVGPIVPGRFLQTHSTFSLNDLKYYYQISNSTAWMKIKEWKNYGWIESTKQGRKTAFKVTPWLSVNSCGAAPNQ